MELGRLVKVLAAWRLQGWSKVGGSGGCRDEVRRSSLGSHAWELLGTQAEAPLFHPPGEQNFIKSLIHFDKDNISDKVLKKIGAYCAQPDFQPDIIGRVSLAAKSLCMWVRAMEVSGQPPGSGRWGEMLWEA